MEQWNSVVEHWNSDGGTVWSNSETAMLKRLDGTVEH